MEDPVETSSEDENDVGSFEGCRTSCCDAERVGVGDVTFAHGCWKERGGKEGEEVGDGCFGARELSSGKHRRRRRVESAKSFLCEKWVELDLTLFR